MWSSDSQSHLESSPPSSGSSSSTPDIAAAPDQPLLHHHAAAAAVTESTPDDQQRAGAHSPAAAASRLNIRPHGATTTESESGAEPTTWSTATDAATTNATDADVDAAAAAAVDRRPSDTQATRRAPQVTITIEEAEDDHHHHTVGDDDNDTHTQLGDFRRRTVDDNDEGFDRRSFIMALDASNAADALSMLDYQAEVDEGDSPVIKAHVPPPRPHVALQPGVLYTLVPADAGGQEHGAVDQGHVDTQFNQSRDAIPLQDLTKNSSHKHQGQDEHATDAKQQQQQQQQQQPRKQRPKSTLDAAGWFSVFTFAWMSELFRQGKRAPLEDEDIPMLPQQDTAVDVTDRLLSAWEVERERAKAKGRAPSLGRAYIRAFGGRFAVAGLYCVLENIFQIAQPVFLGFIITFVADPDAPLRDGLLYALGLLLCVAFFAAAHHHYFFATMRLGMQCRVAAVGAIYRKTLAISQTSLGRMTTGEIVTMISGDVQRFDLTLPFLHALWMGPVSSGVILWLTWREVGPSALAGIFSIFCLLTPVQAFSAKLFGRWRSKTAKLTSERVRIMSEVISGMRVVKMYAWEPAFNAIVSAVRGREMKQIFNAGYMRGANMAFFFVSPTFIGFITFLAYTLSGNYLTSKNVFVTVSLLQVVRMNMTLFFPVALQGISETMIALRRIQAFLEMHDFGEQKLDWGTSPEALAATKSSQVPQHSKYDKLASSDSVQTPDLEAGLPLKSRTSSVLSLGYTPADFPSGAPGAEVLAEYAHEPRFIHVDHLLASWDETEVLVRRGEIKRARAAANKTARLAKAASASGDAKPVVRRKSSKLLRSSNPSTGDAADKSNAGTDDKKTKSSDPPLPVEGESRVTLEDVGFHVSPGRLLAVIGPVASGKSSLLYALLNELPAVAGTVTIKGRIAYAAQESWIIAGTLRENITFGLPFDQAKFDRVTAACALDRDIASFENGDLTEIGERGVTLSGGQRARVSLARAVYFDADVYLLDDPLSAVDAHVGRHLYEHCINGILRDKPRILVTHQVRFLEDADEILMLRNGQIEDIGTYQDLLARGHDLSDTGTQTPNVHSEVPEEAAKSASAPLVAAVTSKLQDNKEASQPAAGSGQLVQKETKATGVVSLKVYWDFFRAAGPPIVFFSLILICMLAQGLLMGADYYLSYWSNIPVADRNNDEHLGIFGGLLCAAMVGAVARAVFFFHVTLTASRNLHDSMFARLLRAPMSFFDTNPTGRVLNRFSKDIGLIDETMGLTFFDFVQCLLLVVGSLLLVAVLNPWVFIAMLPLVLGFAWLRGYYLVTAREIKRIEGITRSPVFSHFSATIQGICTIRGYNVTKPFLADFQRYQDGHTRTWFVFLGSARWLGFRLDVLSILFVAVAAFAAVLARSSLDPGIVGLSLSYAIQLNGIFQWCVRQSAEVEALMTSTERVLEYTRLPEEAEDEIEATKPAPEWPPAGGVSFQGLTMSYRPGLPPVLRNLQCRIAGGEKVGIVGRTGAGKSSLMQALFRLTEPTEGLIEIDGVDTNKLGLRHLRSKISVIPQEPVLFSGTLRGNLDPFNQHSDSELWEALEHVQLSTAIKELPDQLNGRISEAGGNMSVGQKQLICLARAILRRNKILVLDEATASVDLVTDELIQKTIREQFADCTVLTIAHRLNTVMDADKILVMDRGQALEFDEPHVLLTRPSAEGGVFLSLVNETGPFNAQIIKQAARAKHEERKMQRQ